MTDHTKQNKRKYPNNFQGKNCNSNSLINIWNKKSITPSKEDHCSSNTNLTYNQNFNKSITQLTRNHKQTTPKKVQIIGENLQTEKVVMSKRQLMQFTKKFAINKIDYQQLIQSLKQDNHDKAKRIQVLSQQIEQLRLQQDYMMKIMEQLRDRHIHEINSINAKSQALIKMKQGQIDHLGQEITKIREWLQEQKQETKRYIQFLKIKDQIIQNLEWDIMKYKTQRSKDIAYSKCTTQLQTHTLSSTTSHQFISQQTKNHILADCSNLSSTARCKQELHKSIEKIQKSQRNGPRPRVNSASSSKKIILRKQKKQQDFTPSKTKSKREISNKQNQESQQKLDINTTLSLFKKALNNKKQSVAHLEGDVGSLTNLIHILTKQKQQLENQKNEIANKYEQLSFQHESLKKNFMISECSNSHSQMTINYKKANQDHHTHNCNSQKNYQYQNRQKDNLITTKCVFLQKHIKKLTNELNRIQSQGFLQYCEQFSQEQVLDQQIPTL